MRARARIAMLIGVVVLFASFLLVERFGRNEVAESRHEGTNTSTLAELPTVDRPIVETTTVARKVPKARFGKGQLSGRVTYGGLMPSPDMVDMRADPKCRRIITEEDRIRRRIEVDAKGGLAGAVVWVEIDPSLEYRPPSSPAQIRFKKCRFHPETIALQVGQPLVAINDDPLAHNFHAFTVLNEVNFVLPKKGDRRERSFRGADTDGTFQCELHPWEKGRLYVFSHPFFTVTDSKGAFTIKNLPGKGPWRLFAAHPRIGTKELEVTPGRPIEIRFEEKAL